ncbi:MAG: fumarylacetoacetate hydrolase family protein [Bauldia sp.]|nr:fumarylacetoacetate hydrolase family protein [Bauldia sp.]
MSSEIRDRYVFAPSAQAALPVRGTDRLFPVRRIYCVARNYAAHAVEMGADPTRELPFFFQKNPDNLVLDGLFPYPSATSDLHHEIELVVALAGGGRDIPAGRALDHIYGYAVGLDMTRRDLQNEAKQHGRPWEAGKAFEHSAPCSPLVPASEIGHPSAGRVALSVNGELRQKGDLDQLIWKVPEIIAYLSGLFELAAGDLIFTGTPSGVGPVRRGDLLEGSVEGVGTFAVRVV